MASAKDTTVSTVCCSEVIEGMTSTNFMIGTGFIKCIPQTRDGRPVHDAMRVMGIDDVFDAKITSSGHTLSRDSKMPRFTLSFSVTA